MLVNLDEIGDLIKLGNVFFDAHNEFCDDFNVSKIIEIIQKIKDKDGLMSAGAWGYYAYAQQNYELFHKQCNFHDIESVHREWDTASIEKALKFDKPVIRNEYLARWSPILNLEETKRIMKETIEAGAQGVQYYGFAYEGLPGLKQWDSFDYGEMPKFAGNLCQQLNS